MVELLKQPQFSPMSVGQQVITIYAGSTGLFDDMPLKEVSSFMTAFLDWLTSKHPDYIEEIDKTGKFEDSLLKKLKMRSAHSKQCLNQVL